MREENSSGNETNEEPIDGLGQNIPGGIDGSIPLSGPSQRGPRREDIGTQVVRPRIGHITQLDPAMLIRRVEPVYPPPARQPHRQGRVALRAISVHYDSVQSLQYDA